MEIDLNAIASIFAVIVSIIALVTSIFFERLQIIHNKNSVKPISSIQVSDYEDKIAVKIENVGTGPLTIEKLLCKHPEMDDSSSLIKIMPNLEQYWDTFVEEIDGWTIPVNGEVTLIEITPNDEKTAELLREFLEKVTISIDYKDIYNSRFHDERLLDFFGRTLVRSNI